MSNSITAPASTPVTSSYDAGNDTTSSSTTKQGGVSVDENTFLTLLVAQLKNQDPLSPQDGTQFLSQLAQFSQLEQLIGINKNTAPIVSTTTGAAADTSSATATSAGTTAS